MDAESPDLNPLDKLNDKQRKFVVEYLNCLNAAEAARRAGYSVKTARKIGSENLTKPDIQAAISFLGEQIGMSAGEAFKHFTDIARSRIEEYLIVNTVAKSKTIEKPMAVIIDELRKEIEFEAEFARRVKLDKTETKHHAKKQKEREQKLIRYQMELDQNPKASRFVAGPMEWVEDVTLDLVKLAKGQAEGRVKSFSFTEFGPKIELESISNALDKVMQLHGRYKQLPGDANRPKELQSYLLPDGTTIIF